MRKILGGEKDLPDREAKDFFEEHEKLKQAQARAVQRPAQPSTHALPTPSAVTATSTTSATAPLPAPSAASAAPPKQPTPQPRVQPQAVPQPVQQAERPPMVPLEALTFALRELGMDAKPVEALREYAKQLEEKEREVAKKVEELQKLLEAIRRARQVLKQLGV